MSARRLLFYTNKAATGWAALARHIGTTPALPSCSPFPYCATLARRNGTSLALPSVSPSPYCISLRHMSSKGRRAFFLDRIALGLEAEGIPYTEALDKTINEFINENLEINEFLNENIEDVDQSFDSKVNSELDKIQSKLQSFEEHYFSSLKRENEEFTRDIEKRSSEFRYEIDKVIARHYLDLNLERESMRDELAKLHAKIIELITKLDREIHT